MEERRRSHSSPVVALAVADLHLSHKPPLARSSEEDWYEAMRRQLNELESVAKKHKAPILVAGDVFDRWETPSELVNFTIKNFPKSYGVGGNHDLYHHNYENIKRTSYWTLVEAGVITNLEPDTPIDLNIKSYPVRFWGYPCGYPVKPCPDPEDMILEIAVVHQYIWTLDTGYEGAREEDRLKHLWKKIKGFDLVVSGDNHKHFYNRGSRHNQSVWNCGTFFRRKMTERDSWPSIGLIHSDGTVTRHLMDVSQDKFIEVDNTQIEAVDGLDDLVRELEEKNIDSAIDFRENLNRVMDSKGVSRKIKSIVMGALEDK